jgi:hypothetical protein
LYSKTVVEMKRKKKPLLFWSCNKQINGTINFAKLNTWVEMNKSQSMTQIC